MQCGIQKRVGARPVSARVANSIVGAKAPRNTWVAFWTGMCVTGLMFMGFGLGFLCGTQTGSPTGLGVDAIVALEDRVKVLEAEVAGSLPPKGTPLHVDNIRFTHYKPTDGSKEGLTAVGRPAMPGRTVAVSRALAAKGWLGRRVYIPGVGVRVVEDLMATSIEGDAADICVASGARKKGVFHGPMTTID